MVGATPESNWDTFYPIEIAVENSASLNSSVNYYDPSGNKPHLEQPQIRGTTRFLRKCFGDRWIIIDWTSWGWNQQNLSKHFPFQNLGSNKSKLIPLDAEINSAHGREQALSYAWNNS